MKDRIPSPPGWTLRLGGLLALMLGAGVLPARSQTIETALDNPVDTVFSLHTFDTETGNPIPGIEWFGQTTTTHDGIDAVEASNLPAGSLTRLDATIQGPATLSFWWKVDSNNPIEVLGFVSAETSFSISRQVDWQQRTVQIPCGEQVVSWYFRIDPFSNSGLPNAAWIDQVVVTPLPDVPELKTALESPAIDFFSEDWIQAMHPGASGAVGGTVAQSGPVDEGGSTSMRFDVGGPVEISFDWGMEIDISAPDSALVFYSNGVEVARLTDVSQPLTSAGPFKLGPGSHCFTFTYFRGFSYDPDSTWTGGSEGFVDRLNVVQVPESAVLANAVDSAPKVYGKSWFRQTQVTHDGVDAACVQGLDPGDSERLYVELPDDPGLFSFWYKMSTEPNFGFLDIFIDGQFLANNISGERGWTKFEANLGPGRNRVLELHYTREVGGPGNTGDNVVYIDQVSLVPGASNYQPDLSIKAPRSKGGYKGNNRYNKNGANQSGKYLIRRGRQIGKFKLLCQNDCPTNSDTMRFFGTRANRHFDILYITKVDGQLFNITAEFRTGQFSTDTLAYLQTEPYEVWIARKEGGRRLTQTARVRAISNTDPNKSDVVKARLKIQRPRRR